MRVSSFQQVDYSFTLDFEYSFAHNLPHRSKTQRQGERIGGHHGRLLKNQPPAVPLEREVTAGTNREWLSSESG